MMPSSEVIAPAESRTAPAARTERLPWLASTPFTVSCSEWQAEPSEAATSALAAWSNIRHACGNDRGEGRGGRSAVAGRAGLREHERLDHEHSERCKPVRNPVMAGDRFRPGHKRLVVLLHHHEQRAACLLLCFWLFEIPLFLLVFLPVDLAAGVAFLHDLQWRLAARATV